MASRTLGIGQAISQAMVAKGHVPPTTPKAAGGVPLPAAQTPVAFDPAIPPAQAPAPALNQPTYKAVAGKRGRDASIGGILKNIFNKSLFISDALKNFASSKSSSPVYKLMRKFFKPQKKDREAFRDLITKWSMAERGEGTLFSLTYNYKFETGAAGWEDRGQYTTSSPPDEHLSNAKNFGIQAIALYNDYLDTINSFIKDWDNDTQVVLGGIFIYLPLTFLVMRANYVMLGLIQSGKLQTSSSEGKKGFKNTLNKPRLQRMFSAMSSMLTDYNLSQPVPMDKLRKMFKLMVYYLTIHNIKE